MPRVARGGLAVLVLFSASASAGLFTGPDPNWKEGDYAMPPPTDGRALVRFDVPGGSRNRYLIDADSLSVGDDGVVRFVMVVRAEGGAESVTFEGIRCANRTSRIYATGRPGGQWTDARDSDWRPLPDATNNRPRVALANDYFCDGAAPPRDPREVLGRLRGSERGPLHATP